MKRFELTTGTTILFQGDSITDCGRRQDGNGMGGGYPAIVANQLHARFPELDITVLNRGISGNRVRDLKARWQEDCIALKPDLVSIMIGINDTWRRFDSNDPTGVDAFAADYRAILEETRQKLDVPLVLVEPFLLPHPEDRRAWREDLDPKIAVVRDLAREFGAVLVPLDGVFAAASTQRECPYWAGDGVHPTPVGQALIARTWMDCVLGPQVAG